MSERILGITTIQANDPIRAEISKIISLGVRRVAMLSNDGNSRAANVNNIIKTIMAINAYGFTGGCIWERLTLCNPVIDTSKIKSAIKDLLPNNKRSSAKAGNNASTMVIGTAMLNTA